MTKDSKGEKKPVVQRASHHDIFFKEGYSDPRFAKELFRLGLTKEEFSAFNWDSLQSEKDTFQGMRVDLLFSVTLKNDPDKRVKICLLLEHKARFSQEIYYQILKYKVAVIGRSLEETGEAWPVFSVVFYHGKMPWPGEKYLKKGLWRGILSKIPSSLQKDMLDCGLRVVDTHDPRVERAIKDKDTKSRGFLNILKRTWSLKAEAGELKKALSLFDNWPGNKDNLILGVGNYLWATVRGMTTELWEELEREGVKKGIFSKGGYMNTREHIKEEGRQEGWQKGQKEGWQKGQKEGWQKGQKEGWQKGRKEGRQEGIQKVVLNMLQKKADISFISEMTGLSEGEISQLKNGA